MKRKSKFNKSVDDDESGANWQDSYSDLMTDLLAIFVVLFAFAMITQAVVSSNMVSLQESSAGAEISVIEQTFSSGDSILPGQDSVDALVEAIATYIDEVELSEELSVSKQGDNQILLRMASSVLFPSGQADINSSAEPLLGRISELLIEYDNSIKMVRIEGHTDNIPMHNEQFDSNWELSTSRAVNILRWLLEISQLQSEKFSAVGYSEFHPTADNNTWAGRAKNRRVDFIIETVSK